MQPVRLAEVDTASFGRDFGRSRGWGDSYAEEVAVQNKAGSSIPLGFAPAGEGFSFLVGAWGGTQYESDWVTSPMSEWFVLQEGEVTIEPAAGSGPCRTFGAGDVFVVPKGLTYRWRQNSAVCREFFVMCDHSPLVMPPASGAIRYDTDVRCGDERDWWFFCESHGRLAPGSAAPREASHEYAASPCGQFSAGIHVASVCTSAILCASYPFSDERALALHRHMDMYCAHNQRSRIPSKRVHLPAGRGDRVDCARD